MNQGDTAGRRDFDFPTYPLAELHAHLGSSISPLVLWQIAHKSGIKLPKQEFSAFRRYIMLSTSRRMKLNTYFEKIYHPILDRLSSGTQAVEEAVYHSMGGAYRANNIQLVELRCNPMKHNLDAAIDLDHIILAMLRGMERALLECPKLSAGFIFCMAREYSQKRNSIILEKAIRYHRRGVVGIDVAGPASASFHLKDYAPLFKQARSAGLKITIHSGEVSEATDMWEALEYAQPERLGHGIRAAYDIPLMKELAARHIVLEVCPMSNLATKAVENIDELRFILRRLVEYKVPFCINTDWPEVITKSHLRQQFRFLRSNDLLTEAELTACNQTAFAASFTPSKKGIQAYL